MNAQAQVFRGRSSRAALEAVRREMGPDAIIVSTREVRGASLLANEIEVVAQPAERSVSSTLLSRCASEGPSHAQGKAGREEAKGPATSSLLAPPRDVVDEEPLDSTLDKAKSSLLMELVARDLPKDLVIDALRRAGGASPPSRAQVADALSSQIATTSPPWVKTAKGKSRVVALVGPTGVGKTTTVAKIAARAIFEEGLSVSLITIDNYRVGAIEQLARYAEIMGVAVHVASDSASLQRALAHQRNAALVLIDTAGRSPRDREAMGEQLELVAAIPEVEVMLTVSAATTERQLMAMRGRYASTKPSALIVTKIDEADAPGAPLRIAASLGVPLSCCANGQRVPEDLFLAEPRSLAMEAVGT